MTTITLEVILNKYETDNSIEQTIKIDADVSVYAGQVFVKNIRPYEMGLERIEGLALSECYDQIVDYVLDNYIGLGITDDAIRDLL